MNGTLRRAAGRVALAAASLALSCAEPPRAVDGILLVVLDTTRADRCSFVEPGRGTTPRLEEWARSSAVFTDAWSPGCWTAPTTASLFTGRPPDRHGLRNGRALRLAPEETTIAERLASAGWDTGLFSCNLLVSREWGLDQGFGTDVRAFESVLNRPAPAAKALGPAADWIESRRAAGRPWFCCVVLMEPHTPWDPGPDATGKFVPAELPPAHVRDARRIGKLESLGWGLGWTPEPPGVMRAASALYDAEVSEADLAVGAFLDRLGGPEGLARTLLVVTSDHGEGLGDHGWIEHTVRLHRELLRVPLLVRLPGRFDGGRRVPDVVRLEDVTETIASVAGIPPHADSEGVPLDRDLPGRVSFAQEGAAASRSESFGPGRNPGELLLSRASLRFGRWHAIFDDAGGVELYDVEADPGELRNVAGAEPEVVAQASRMLEGRDWR